jgi:hypothetical protein
MDIGIGSTAFNRDWSADFTPFGASVADLFLLFSSFTTPFRVFEDLPAPAIKVPHNCA